MMKQVIQFLVLLPLKLYQFLISPVLGAHCRFLPTCSDYADQAIQQHGVIKGGWLALSRIVRCGPWARSGYDPVPEEFSLWRRSVCCSKNHHQKLKKKRAKT